MLVHSSEGVRSYSRVGPVVSNIGRGQVVGLFSAAHDVLMLNVNEE